MKGPYVVTFDDDTSERVTADNPDQAKQLAKNKRIRDLDPGGKMAREAPADLFSHASVKVRRVAEGAAAMLITLLTFGALGALLWLDDSLALGSVLSTHAGVLEVMAASGTAIGATLAALTAVTGDNLQVPFFPESKNAWLLQVWSDVQVAGTFRIRSAKAHDNVSGIRMDTIISDPCPLLPTGTRHRLYSGETLNIDLAGSAVAGDIEFVCLLRYFEELSAQHSNLITYDELMRRAGPTLTVENTIATVATGLWGGDEAINAEIDQFHARSMYAITGYLVDTECAAVAWRGPDFANVRLGGPGLETQRELTADWFVHLARMTGLPLIPVFNGDNKAATFVTALQDENGADVTLTTNLVELRSA